MGKKKNTPKKLAVLSKSGADYSKEPSEASDLESIAASSFVADLEDTSDDEYSPSVVVITDSFAEQVENAQDKRIATRTKAIEFINRAMRKNCISEVVGKWKITLFEIVEKNLRKTPEEILTACSMAALICLQLGVETEDAFQNSLTALRSVCADASASEEVRSVCAQAIGICVYLSCEQTHSLLESLKTLKSVWTSMKSVQVSGSLFSSALFSWVLLLERCTSSLISMNIEEVQPKLCQFLEAISVDIRISAGEAMAILYEIAVENIDEDFQFHNHQQLRAVLDGLAADSVKYHAKRDKKIQKFSFRQINDAIFNEKRIQTPVKFNKLETLQLNGCHIKLLYDLLCQLLKGDFNKHLSENEVLRELFDLGPILANIGGQLDGRESKAEKNERMKHLNDASKARFMHRAKKRDQKDVDYD